MRASKRAKTKEEEYDLSRDTLMCIFNQLSSPKDLLSCRVVCKKWKNLASHNSIWDKFVKELPKQERIPSYRYFIRATFYGFKPNDDDRTKVVQYFMSDDGVEMMKWLVAYLRPFDPVDAIRYYVDGIEFTTKRKHTIHLCSGTRGPIQSRGFIPYNPIDWLNIIKEFYLKDLD